METIIIRKTGSTTIGFGIDPLIIEKYGLQEGDIIRINIIQVFKPTTKEKTDLEHISMLKKISKDHVVVVRKKIAQTFHIEAGDVLIVEFSKS